jgi:fasciclin domain-containing protein
MKQITRYNIIAALLLVVVFGCVTAGCNKWKDIDTLSDPESGQDLFQRVQSMPELSRFAELLSKTGYDQLIASSKNYTVFAPTNDALATIDPAVLNDTAKLRLFVGNHIANQVQQVEGSNVVRLPMINGKYNNLQGMQFDEAKITTANKYGKNGLLHIIDKAVPALSNVWGFVQDSPLMPTYQKAFLLSQKDSSGNYYYFRNVYDMRDEKKQYTFFAMADTSYLKEMAKYIPFYATSTGDSTIVLSQLIIVRDLAIEGAYTAASLPDTVLSKYNTKVGINKSDIVQTIKVSNGYVHLMRNLPVLPKHKFQQYIIQGENFTSTKLDRSGNTYIRERYNPVTGKDFRDVLVFNHGNAQYYLGYRLTNVPAMKYKAYWVALHDNINNNTGTYKQLLGIETPLGTKLPYTTVSPNNYNEVYLGEFTLPLFNATLNIYLTADNSTNSDLNKITVDYIRLEPVL